MAHNQSQALMNNTKWEEIREAMLKSPNVHLWRTKDIETGHISPWDGEWFYHFRIGAYKCIEWLEVKTESEDIRNKVLEILREIHVPGELLDDVIRVYGHVEIGKHVDYL